MSYPVLPEFEGIPPEYQTNVNWVSDPNYQGGGYYSSESGYKYDVAQLEKLWNDAGGDPNVAPDMAYIAAYDESGGYAGAWNSSGATGLWQVEWPSNYSGSREDLFTPLVNAQQAVALYNASGFAPWGSDKYQNLGIPPATSVPGENSPVPGGKPSSGTNTQAQQGLAKVNGGTVILDPKGDWWIAIAISGGVVATLLQGSKDQVKSWTQQKYGKSVQFPGTNVNISPFSGAGFLGTNSALILGPFKSKNDAGAALVTGNYPGVSGNEAGLLPSIWSALGFSGSPVDLAERLGLILLGASLVILGFFLIANNKTFKIAMPGGGGRNAIEPEG